jgi:F-type H+-transporting ATPase subunit alpha
MSVAEMGLMLYTANEGFLREVEVEKIRDFEKALISYMNAEHKELMDRVSETGEYNDEIEGAFKGALDKFMSTQTW